MSSETVRFHGRYLAIREKDGWEYTSRTNASGVAVIVAVTPAQEVVLVEQFRIPVSRNVIELPAGLVGDGADPDEDMGLAAARELEEETGYRPGRLEELLCCPSTAGLADEMITFFLATDLQRVGPGGGDESEDIRVHEVPLDEVDEWLQARRGDAYLDPKIWTGLYWILERTPAGVTWPAARD